MTKICPSEHNLPFKYSSTPSSSRQAPISVAAELNVSQTHSHGQMARRQICKCTSGRRGTSLTAETVPAVRDELVENEDGCPASLFLARPLVPAVCNYVTSIPSAAQPTIIASTMAPLFGDLRDKNGNYRRTFIDLDMYIPNDNGTLR